MQKKGITPEKIYQAATQLIIEKGYDRFSLRELAGRLGVQPASLYSHVKNAEEISVAVGRNAIELLSQTLEKAIEKDNREEAFIAMAHAYRKFAHENPELYKAIMALPGASETELKEDEQKTIRPMRAAVENFVPAGAASINFQRFVRSAMHGFIMLESEGFMRDKSIPADDSYDMLISTCLSALKKASVTSDVPGNIQ